MERWCETNAIGSLHGRCRVHRAEILRLRGSCNEAESQALVACDELRPYMRRELGWPLNELGRIRLHKADLVGAEEAFLAAHHAGWDPQPGLALVQLARGDVANAAASLRDALDHPVRVPSKERPPNTDLQRAPLLEAQVEIEIAAGDIDRARSATDELEVIAARFESKALVGQRRRRSRKGAARRWRRRWRRTVLVRSGATLERGRRPVRGGDRTPRPRRSPSRQRQRAPGRCWRAKQLARSSPRSSPRRRRRRSDEDTARRHARRAAVVSSNVFRREGDYWSVIFDGHTVHVRDLKGMRYLARLLADPGREYHVLDLVASETASRRAARQQRRSSHSALGTRRRR